MSKITLTTLGAASVAAAVPAMHFMTKRRGDEPVIKVSTMALFMVGWVLLATGLSRPPPGTESSVGKDWKQRQLALSVAGAVLIVTGVGLVRFRAKLNNLPLAVGAAVFVAGWAILTSAVVLSDPDFKDMSGSEQAGRVTQAIASTLTIISGAALISMSDAGVLPTGSSTVPLSSTTLEAAAGSTFALGWVGLVATSALQD